MEELKTLANCTPIEFLKQANKIRKGVAEYLNHTKILDKKMYKSIDEVLDAMLDENAEATVRILGLMCFKETEEEINSLEPADLLVAALDMFSSERVMSFFIKLKNSGLMNMADILPESISEKSTPSATNI